MTLDEEQIIEDQRLDALIEEQEIEAQIERFEESYHGINGPQAKWWAWEHETMAGFKGPWG